MCCVSLLAQWRKEVGMGCRNGKLDLWVGKECDRILNQKAVLGVVGIAQWQSACSAQKRPWFPSSAWMHTHTQTHCTFMVRPGEILKVQRDHKFKWKTTVIVIGEILKLIMILVMWTSGYTDRGGSDIDLAAPWYDEYMQDKVGQWLTHRNQLYQLSNRKLPHPLLEQLIQ